jgi:5-oxoprolinase (ATP-hydrolysing)
MRPGWQFWIDRGGTFTDVIGVSPSGQLHVRKVLSEGTTQDPGIRGAQDILSVSGASVQGVKVGTTVATNALLERTGEPVLLVTTKGFGDGLRIGYQNRPDIFARHIVLSDRLYSSVIEASERIDSDGATLTPLDVHALRADLQRAREAGLRAVARPPPSRVPSVSKRYPSPTSSHRWCAM